MPRTTRTATASADDRALGTDVRVVVTRPERLAAAKSAADSVLRDIDDACSRFRDDSELSRLNARAGSEAAVSPLLGLALEHALRGARVSGGAVDPTVGTALRLAGYDADFAAVPRLGAALSVTLCPVPGWKVVHLDAAARRVRFPRGVEIDLGATAKALAADLAATAAMAAARAGGVLVSLGGDIALAGEPPAGGWAIQLSGDSSDPIDAAAEQVRMRGGAVATSSTRVRRWRRGCLEMHHIIDPRTGRPVEGRWQLATVAAATCVDANIASTAAIVWGDAAPAWLGRMRLPARLVDGGGSVVRVGGWPSAGDTEMSA